MRKLIVAMLVLGCVSASCKSEPQEKPDDQPEQTAEEREGEQQPDGGGDDTITDEMADEHEGEEPTATEAAEMEPSQPVTTRQVDYATLDGDAVTGYYAEPEKFEGELPGLMVIQEWWGLNDNIRKMTERLAGEGYRALAVDLYEGQVAREADRAQELMQQAMQDKQRLQQNIRQAHQYLDQKVGAPDIGVVGWCFGGGWSLQTALMLPDKIDATVIYYGQLVTDREQLEKLDMPVLGLFGADDEAIPPEQVEQFESTLEELDKEARIHIYEEAGHAFANPSGERYNADAATDAWKKTVEFLNEHLK